MQSKSIYRDEGDLVDYPEEEEEIKETKSRSEMIASMGQRSMGDSYMNQKMHIEVQMGEVNKKDN